MHAEKRLPALQFFALTFVLSWLIWVPLALSHLGIAFQIPEATSNLVRLPAGRPRPRAFAR